MSDFVVFNILNEGLALGAPVEGVKDHGAIDGISVSPFLDVVPFTVLEVFIIRSIVLGSSLVSKGTTADATIMCMK